MTRQHCDGRCFACGVIIGTAPYIATRKRVRHGDYAYTRFVYWHARCARVRAVVVGRYITIVGAS